MSEEPTSLPLADCDLVAQARTDRGAFSQLYDMYYPQIFRYCRRRLFRWEDAEEATADVFRSVAREQRGRESLSEK